MMRSVRPPSQFTGLRKVPIPDYCELEIELRLAQPDGQAVLIYVDGLPSNAEAHSKGFDT